MADSEVTRNVENLPNSMGTPDRYLECDGAGGTSWAKPVVTALDGGAATAGDVLENDGAGNMSWVAPATVGTLNSATASNASSDTCAISSAYGVLPVGLDRNDAADFVASAGADGIKALFTGVVLLSYHIDFADGASQNDSILARVTKNGTELSNTWASANQRALTRSSVCFTSSFACTANDEFRIEWCSDSITPGEDATAEAGRANLTLVRLK